MAAYVAVASAADLPPGQAKLVSAGDQRVALFNVGGTCYHRRHVHPSRRPALGGHPSRLLKKSVEWDRQIDPGVLPCSQYC